MKDEILTIKEAAKLLKYSEATLRSWVKKGKVPAFRVGRKYRIRIRDINKEFKQHLTVSYDNEQI